MFELGARTQAPLHPGDSRRSRILQAADLQGRRAPSVSQDPSLDTIKPTDYLAIQGTGMLAGVCRGTLRRPPFRNTNNPEGQRSVEGPRPTTVEPQGNARPTTVTR